MGVRNNRTNIAYGFNTALQPLSPEPITSTRNPGANDIAELGTVWVNKSANSAYLLTSVVANAASWESITASGGGGTGVFTTVEVTGTVGNVLHVDTGNTLLGGALAVTGNETVGGTLGVTGATTLSSVGVTGAATADTLLITHGAGSDGLTVSDADTALGGDLVVTGTSTFNDNVLVNAAQFEVAASESGGVGNAVNISATAADGIINIEATGATAQITIGADQGTVLVSGHASATLSSDTSVIVSAPTGTALVDGSTLVTLQVSAAGAVDVDSNNATGTTVNIARDVTGAATKTVNIGTINGTSTIHLLSAGGVFNTGRVFLGSTNTFPALITGNGDPSGAITAPQGSLYLNVTGSGVANRAFINTDSGTGWAAVTTAS